MIYYFIIGILLAIYLISAQGGFSNITKQILASPVLNKFTKNGTDDWALGIILLSVAAFIILSWPVLVVIFIFTLI